MIDFEDGLGSLGRFEVSPNPEYQVVASALGLPSMRVPRKVVLIGSNLAEANANPRMRARLDLENMVAFRPWHKYIVGVYHPDLNAFFVFPSPQDRLTGWSAYLDRHENMHAFVHQIKEYYPLRDFRVVEDNESGQVDRRMLNGSLAEGLAEWGAIETEASIRRVGGLEERLRFHRDPRGLEKFLTSLSMYKDGYAAVVRMMEFFQRSGLDTFESLVVLINAWPARSEAFRDSTGYARRLVESLPLVRIAS